MKRKVENDERTLIQLVSWSGRARAAFGLARNNPMYAMATHVMYKDVRLTFSTKIRREKGCGRHGPISSGVATTASHR